MRGMNAVEAALAAGLAEPLADLLPAASRESWASVEKKEGRVAAAAVAAKAAHDTADKIEVRDTRVEAVP